MTCQYYLRNEGHYDDIQQLEEIGNIFLYEQFSFEFITNLIDFVISIIFKNIHRYIQSKKAFTF